LLLCQVLPGKVGFCQGCKNSLFLVGFRNIWIQKRMEKIADLQIWCMIIF
jgi:hypothetical protein